MHSRNRKGKSKQMCLLWVRTIPLSLKLTFLNIFFILKWLHLYAQKKVSSLSTFTSMYIQFRALKRSQILPWLTKCECTQQIPPPALLAHQKWRRPQQKLLTSVSFLFWTICYFFYHLPCLVKTCFHVTINTMNMQCTSKYTCIFTF